jgi:hypothetical protein
MLRAQGQAAGSLAQQSHGAECRRPLLPEICVAGIRSHGTGPQESNALPGNHQLAAIAVSERPQHHRIDHRENRRTGANAEGQRQNRGGRESRALAQRS